MQRTVLPSKTVLLIGLFLLSTTISLIIHYYFARCGNACQQRVILQVSQDVSLRLLQELFSLRQTQRTEKHIR